MTEPNIETMKSVVTVLLFILAGRLFLVEFPFYIFSLVMGNESPASVDVVTKSIFRICNLIGWVFTLGVADFILSQYP